MQQAKYQNGTVSRGYKAKSSRNSFYYYAYIALAYLFVVAVVSLMICLAVYEIPLVNWGE